MKLGILNDIENSICQCNVNDNEYIELKNDTLCPIPKQNNCSPTLYNVNIATVCELSKFTKHYSTPSKDYVQIYGPD